jgi:hypothetical protein
MTLTNTPALRTILTIDAGLSAAAGVGLVAASFLMTGLLGLPAPLLFWAGLALAPWTLALLIAARSERLPTPALYGIVGVNLLWVAASLFVTFGPMLEPTLFGKIFVVVQAVAVAVFAELQMWAGKKAPKLA